MGLNINDRPKQPSKNRVEQPPLTVGGHAARVVQIIDLGLQARKPFKGVEKAPADMISITYELSHDFMVDEKGEPNPELPRWISEEFAVYSLDADKATSTQRYTTFDPKLEHKGDFTKTLAAPVTVVVVHNPGSGANAGKVYDNVGAVTAAVSVPGYVQPALVNPAVFFDLSDPSLEVFNKLPKFLQDKIKANLNYNGSKLQGLLGEVSVANSPQPTPAGADTNSTDNPY